MRTSETQILRTLSRIHGGDLDRDPDRVQCEPMPAHASSRRYYRVTAPGRTPDRLVAMCFPVEEQHDEITKLAPTSEHPFLNVQRFLHARGVPVPAVLAADLDQGVVLLEDLGDTTFEARLLQCSRSDWPALYAEAVDFLADLHERCETPDPTCLAFRRRFDADLLRAELDHFREWGLEALYGRLAAPDAEQLARSFDALVVALQASPEGFVHRDFQSRNLMCRGPRGRSALAVIDFQDALIGPRAYDLVALLCDSYVSLDESLQRSMIRRYVDSRGIPDADAFEREFWRVALHRKLKDAGRFVYIDRKRGNPAFLDWFAPSLRYVGRALVALGCESEALSELLYRLIPGFPGTVPAPLPSS